MTKPDTTNTTPKTAPNLPGDFTRAQKVDRMLRVDHAGETGAVRIYEGQLAVFGENHPKTAMIKHMLEQEEHHLSTFNQLINERGTRPSALNPLWNIAGFTLGAATALMGEKAAMACTAAVEEVIDQHYEEQRKELKTWGDEDPLEETIEKFQAEEIEHREIALKNGAEDTPGHEVLSSAIRVGCRAAIWLAKRV